MVSPNLKKAIEEQDWEETSRIFSDHSQADKRLYFFYGFDILWAEAPLDTIRILLKSWPDAFKLWGVDKNLVHVKLRAKQWDFLGPIFVEFPRVLETCGAPKAAIHGAPHDFLKSHWNEVGALVYFFHDKDWEKVREILKHGNNVSLGDLSENDRYDLWKDASLTDIPLDVFELMLEQLPNIPLEAHHFTFEAIQMYKLEHFRAVMDRCSGATNVTQTLTHLTPLLLICQNKEQMNADWINPILKANQNAARAKDFDGKTPLHLAYQHGASSEIVDMLAEAHPGGEKTRDNLGRLPKDLANKSEKAVFTPADETSILVNRVTSNQGGDLNAEKKAYPNDAVVVCRGDMLTRDLQAEDKVIYETYLKQVLVRHRIFETLLDEFSKLVGVDDKDVIQKAAAIQALAAQDLSKKNGTVIKFGSFENPGYWFQQEILKLVMRVYHETQSSMDLQYPSILDDAEICLAHVGHSKNGKPIDKHFKAYDDLTRWLTEGLDSNLYSLQGPVLKPLQSSFNKLFIRRGQTSFHVIGDMVRATLLVGNKAMLEEIVQKIGNTFPNITKGQFQQPDKFDKIADFLTYVHGKLNLLPHSDVLPYRFKANSSQEGKKKPLWYNLNFFLQVPEYHRVGFSEMFVACELQIGVEEEVNKHRSVHDAYERDRILSNQPLLKNYDAMRKEGNDCTGNDKKLIEKVLFGEIASEVLVPSATAGNENQNSISLFKHGPFSLSKDEILAGSFVKPGGLCVNNRTLNWHAFNCPKKDNDGKFRAALVLARQYQLEKSKRYFVDSFVIKEPHFENFSGTVGLYAVVGSYLVQIACNGVAGGGMNDIVVVKSGRNYSYLEQACPIPVGTTALEVIAYGKVGDLKYDEVNLSLRALDVH